MKMNCKLFGVLVAICTFVMGENTVAEVSTAKVGEAAPKFEVLGTDGKTHNLEEYKGQWLVLEWTNKDCPYVRKHYESNNMQGLQKKYSQKGVKWLSVISSAEGKQGFLDADGAKAQMAKVKAAATLVLLDAEGTMGRSYGARTTPHMFVIDPKGVLVYNGAIDDNNSANPAVIPESKNYLVAALDSAMAGESVENTSTTPYGCSVKY